MKTKHVKNYKTQRGVSLVEMIVYIAILSLVTASLILVVVSILGNFAHLKAYEEMAHSGTVTLERMTREIRRAHSVDTISSVFGTHPGVLTLDTIDYSENPTTIVFSLSGGRVMIQDGATTSPLSTSDVTISNLEFNHIINANTEGVAVNLTTLKVIKGATTTRQFRTFVVLDG